MFTNARMVLILQIWENSYTISEGDTNLPKACYLEDNQPLQSKIPLEKHLGFGVGSCDLNF